MGQFLLLFKVYRKLLKKIFVHLNSNKIKADKNREKL